MTARHVFMPLLTIDELESSFPFFKGGAGNSAARFLMKMLAVDKINALYDRNCLYKGPEFAAAILRDIGVAYEVINPEVLETMGDGPFITVSNHPYGSIDGIILVDMFGHLRKDYKVMVNKILSRIKAMDMNFISVTPNGNSRNMPTGDSIAGIKAAMKHVREGHPVGIFPSGAVSDLDIRTGAVRDREWQEPVMRMIRKLNVPILPVRFLDGNSKFYYMLGLIDWRLRLMRLPSEVFNKRGRKEHVMLGNVITPEMQDSFPDIASFSEHVRRSVYEPELKKTKK